MQLESIEPWHRIFGININHKFTTTSGERRQQTCHVTPYSGFVIPAGIKPNAES